MWIEYNTRRFVFELDFTLRISAPGNDEIN